MALALLFFLGSVGYYYKRAHSGRLYAYQQSYSAYDSSSDQYRIAVITDMDTASKVEGKDEWRALLKIGVLVRGRDGSYSVNWKEEKELRSKYNEGGRGMELSELVFYNNKLLACDDRTGIIFEVDVSKGKVFPRYVFGNGDGSEEKGFKCEWMCVRDDKLYVGSMGKDWTTADGQFVNDHPNWVKVITPDGLSTAVNWRDNYVKVSQAVKITKPSEGYMVHEAVGWNYSSNTWVIMPRRVAFTEYDDKADALKGSNHFFITDDSFSLITVERIGDLIPSHGFSSFKFLPHRPNEVLALKSVETDDALESYIMVFDMSTGNILMPETRVGPHKFEGVEFI